MNLFASLFLLFAPFEKLRSLQTLTNHFTPTHLFLPSKITNFIALMTTNSASNTRTVQGVLNLSWVSLLFITLLLLLSLALFVHNLISMQVNKRNVLLLLAHFTRVEHLCSQIEACQMENASLIKSIIHDEAYPLLEDSYDAMLKDSQKLYQNKWAVSPQEYFHLNTLLTSKQFTHLHNDQLFKQLAFGLMISALGLIFPLALGNLFSSRVLPFALLPAFISLAFFLLGYQKNHNYRHELENSIQKFSSTLAKRLPVFSDLAGSAVLVDSFLQYDRNMSKSVQRLSNSVSSLLTHEMVNTIADTVKESIEASLAPSLVESYSLLQSLSKEVTVKQEQGMAQLAKHFSEELGKNLALQLNPFYQQVNAYALSLGQMSDQVKEIFEQQKIFQSETLRLGEHTQAYLQALSSSQDRMSQEADKLLQVQEQIALACDRLSKLQSDGEGSLVQYIQSFATQIHQFRDFLSGKLENFQEENAKNRLYIDQMLQQERASTEQYQSLSQTMITGSQALTRQADFINRQLDGLSAQLNKAVQNFNLHLNEGVRQTLEEFDEGLAEINDRLSISVSEIKQALPKGPSSVQTHLHSTSAPFRMLSGNKEEATSEQAKELGQD